jgi:2-hydroxychromene-2-carboxylate isomerase
MQWRQKGEINTHQGARDIGLDAKEMGAAVRSKYVEERLLKMNIRRGMKIRLMGTPGFLIDGQLYQGTLPFENIEDLRKH